MEKTQWWAADPADGIAQAILSGESIPLEQLCVWAATTANAHSSPPGTGEGQDESYTQHTTQGLIETMLNAQFETKQQHSRAFSAIPPHLARRNPLMSRILIDDNAADATLMAESHPSWLQQKDIEGRTALMLAAGAGQVQTLEALLPMSNAHARDQQGKTALMLAAQEGQAACVKALLSASDVSMTTRQGTGAMYLAASQGCAVSLQWIVSACSPQQQQEQVGLALQVAVSKRRAACIDVLAIVASNKALQSVEQAVCSSLLHRQVPIFMAALERKKLAHVLHKKRGKHPASFNASTPSVKGALHPHAAQAAGLDRLQGTPDQPGPVTPRARPRKRL